MRTSKTILFIYFILSAVISSAQNKQLFYEGKPATDTAFWILYAQKELKDFGKYDQVSILNNAINHLYQSKNTFLNLPLSDKNGEQINAALYLQNIPTVNIKENNLKNLSSVNIPKLYTGSITGMKEKNTVLLTLAPDYISLVAYLPNEKIAVEKSKLNGKDIYTIQHSNDITFKIKPFECNLSAVPTDAKTFSAKNEKTLLSSSDKCTSVFVDCSYNLFIQQNNDVQNTVNYVYSIWNGVRALYANEQMNVKIAEINVWTFADPFNTSVSTVVANKSFADYYQNNYFGNMAMLLDWSSLNGGIAGGYGWAKAVNKNQCGNYIANPSPNWNFGSFIYLNLNASGNFLNFPVSGLSWAMEASTHELGHLFGSFHTQWCGWSGGAIDNCFTTEGGCVMGPAPVNGGTIMSYCHLTAAGINYNNGFGPQPGNTIRNFAVNNNCIPLCDCVANKSIGNISTQGYYHIEASNLVTANGVLPAANSLIKLDGGVQVVLQPGFKAYEGSKVQAYIDGCNGIR